MKRILQIGMTSNYGGIESFIMNLYRNIDRTKFKFDFIDMESNDRDLAYSEEIEKLGGKIYKIPSRRENIIENKKQLTEIINKGNYDFIHNNVLTWSYSYGISIPLNKTKGRVIVHSHNPDMDKKLFIRRILNQINRRYNHKNIIRLACSKKAGQWLFRDKEFKVVLNGIDTQLYKFNRNIRQDYRKKFHVENNRVFLHVGRLSYQKNHIYLLKLFKNILRADPEAYLFLVGDGELHDKLVNLVQQMGLTSKVIFLGIRQDVYNLMQMSDCFLFPSFYEGLGIVLIEAQATGLPCLVSNVIPQEAFITPYIKKMDININPEHHVLNALKLSRMKIDRELGDAFVRDANYDIKNTVKIMEDIYLE